MFRFTPSVTKLSSAIALVLFAGSASASIVAETTSLPSSSAETLSPGDWAATYFIVKDINVCSNGCDLSGVKLKFDLSGGYSTNPSQGTAFAGVKLEVFSSVGAPGGPTLGTSLFQLNNPASVAHTQDAGTGSYVNFTADAQSQALPALIQPNTGYWLKLTNESQTPEFGWFYDGEFPQSTDKYWISSQYGSGSGTPFIFEITGVNSATNRLTPPPSSVPLPGAAWMMGSVLLGFTVAGRRNKTNLG